MSFQTPTVTVNGRSGDEMLVKVERFASGSHSGKIHSVTEIHSHLPEFEKVRNEPWKTFGFFGNLGFGSFCFI